VNARNFSGHTFHQIAQSSPISAILENRGEVYIAMAYSKFNFTEEWMGFRKTALTP
jgi:hypothetical protein